VTGELVRASIRAAQALRAAQINAFVTHAFERRDAGLVPKSRVFTLRVRDVSTRVVAPLPALIPFAPLDVQTLRARGFARIALTRDPSGALAVLTYPAAARARASDRAARLSLVLVLRRGAPPEGVRRCEDRLLPALTPQPTSVPSLTRAPISQGVP
jgi:hypothetical protein